MLKIQFSLSGLLNSANKVKHGGTFKHFYTILPIEDQLRHSKACVFYILLANLWCPPGDDSRSTAIPVN